jgi:hypothetical protein
MSAFNALNTVSDDIQMGPVPSSFVLDKQRLVIGDMVYDLTMGQGVVALFQQGSVLCHFDAGRLRVLYDLHGCVADKRRLFVNKPELFSFKSDEQRALCIRLMEAAGARKES